MHGPAFLNDLIVKLRLTDVVPPYGDHVLSCGPNVRLLKFQQARDEINELVDHYACFQLHGPIQHLSG